MEWRPSAAWEVRNTAFFATTYRDWRNIESYSLNPATRLVARSSFGDLDHDQKVYGDRLEALYKSRLAGMENRFVFGAEANLTRFESARNGFLGGNVVAADNPRSIASSQLTGVVYRSPARDVSLDRYSWFVEDQLSVTSRLKLVADARHDPDVPARRAGLSLPSNARLGRPVRWAGARVARWAKQNGRRCSLGGGSVPCTTARLSALRCP